MVRYKAPPKELDADGSYLHGGCNMTGDHGGPTWPNYYFYHNTAIRTDMSWRGYYGFGIGGRGTRYTQRRVFNNIFVQLSGMPGLNFGAADHDVIVDGNLHWGLIDGRSFTGDYAKKFGRKMAFRRKPYPDAWSLKDIYADPRFKLLNATSNEFDVRLTDASPAIDAGVELPESWFDPLRGSDNERPDLGAFPKSYEPLNVGRYGRIRVGSAER